MILEENDIELRSITQDDIELIRFWRNSDRVKKHMLTQEYITPEQQIKWFASLEKKDDEYFIIHQSNKPIGLIWFNEKGEHRETGFYIYETNQQNSVTPYKIVSLFHKYLFEEKKFPSLQCIILHENKRALRFNTSLGYKLVQEAKEYNTFTLSYEDYKKNDARITKLLHKENS